MSPTVYYDPPLTHDKLFGRLIKLMSAYHPSGDFSKVEEAYLLAHKAHEGQLRKSGEPYIIHPISVACILAELRADRESVIAGLLHDVIEDTHVSYAYIDDTFGSEVAALVDGVTKLDNIEDAIKEAFKSKAAKLEDKKAAKIYREEVQAENLRKMFLAMAGDIRVILIKLADRLHNMRTLGFLPEAKRQEKSQETLEIYCPMAHRLGISKLRTEMEDLSLRYLYPTDFDDLAEKLLRRQSERQAYVNDVVETFNQRLKKAEHHNHPLEAHVEGRPKHLFSIFKKMKNNNKTLDEIYDLFAIRIIVNELSECYEVLGIVHDTFKPIHGRFKDYISTPKPNGYQSLHTGVIGPEGEDVEVQIRTWEMHRTSEYGIAAHWLYKEGGSSANRHEEKLAWLGRILEWQRDMQDNSEFLTTVKREFDVFSEHIYCFTPRGEVISLLKDSTPIDFAYAIHSAVGNRMVGAKVNGSIVTLEHALRSGDRVDILTSQNSKGPSRDWLKIIKTSEARTKINQWFRKEDKQADILRGLENLERSAARKKLNLQELLTADMRKLFINKYSVTDWDSLLASIGRGAIKEGKIISRLHEEHEKELAKHTPPEIKLAQESSERDLSKRKKKNGILIDGVTDMEVRFPRCCSPVPGDEIMGYITRGRGVAIHRTDCSNVIKMNEIERQRLIAAEWPLPDDTTGIKYRTDLKIFCTNTKQADVIHDVSRILGKEKVSMVSFNGRIISGEVVVDVGLEITTRQQLNYVIEKLQQVKGVFEIERVHA